MPRRLHLLGEAVGLGVSAERDGRIVDIYTQDDRARLIRVWLNLAECSRYRSPFASMRREVHRLSEFHVFESMNRCAGLVRCDHHEGRCVWIADANRIYPT